jgi:hypothetical protein
VNFRLSKETNCLENEILKPIEEKSQKSHRRNSRKNPINSFYNVGIKATIAIKAIIAINANIATFGTIVTERTIKNDY